MTKHARSEKQQQVRGRRRARWTMRVLTGVCAVVALGIGASQITSNGLQTFINRPEGVGATPAADDAPLQAEAANPTQARAKNDGAQSGAADAPSPDVSPAQPQYEPGSVAPQPRGDRPRPGVRHPRPGGGRRRPPRPQAR